MTPLLVLSRHLRALVALILLGGVSSLHAVQVYVDATSGAGGNTYNNATSSLTDWSVTSGTANTTDNKWGVRTAGTGASGYNTNACELYVAETGATLRTEVTGLLPSTAYTGLRVYMIGSTTATNNFTLDVSLDGVQWTTYSDYDTAGFTGTIVDTSNNGVGTPLTGTLTGTRRFWHALPNASTNGAGVLKFYIRGGTGASGRSVYDGIGYDNASVTAPADPYSDSVHISEFMADNPGPVILPGSLEDMDLNSSDWIELHNSGNIAADLSGWHLTDDPLLPNMWAFPAGTVLNPDARLLVFASGKNRQLNGVELHTNFKLSISGFLQLSRPAPSGPDVVLSAFGSTTTGYPSHNGRSSYGSSAVPPTALSYGFFPTPTPLTANSATTVADFVRSADTDIDRGIFTSPFTVTLSCPTPGATILYSLDGSVPVQGAPGTTAILPTDDLTAPAGTLNVTTTTILRTRAVKSGLGPSKIDTHTYLFPAHVLNQTTPPAHFPASAAWGRVGADWAMDPDVVNHVNPDNRCTVNDLLSLPSVSLVMDWSELFGTSGVYPAISPIPQEGYAKPANLELLNPDGSTSAPNLGNHFATLGRAHVFGGTSQQRWKVDKLSLNFNCLGNVSTDIFGDTAAGSHSRFILDGRMGNTWVHSQDSAQRTRGDYIRDEVAAATQRKIGQAGTHSRRIHLYLNGLYWGLYTLHEKPDAEFQAAYQGGEPDDWDVLKHNPNYRNDAVSCLSDGTFINPASTSNTKTNNTAYVNYLEMVATVGAGVDLTNATNYANVATKLDIDAFIDYIILNFALNNFDWSHQNWYASYRRTSPNGRWRFHSWDAENILRFDTEETVSGSGLITSASQANTPTAIHQRLATNAEYRMRFADRVQKWCFNDGPLSVAGIQATCNEQFDLIDSAIRAESARWGDNVNTTTPYTRVEHWLVERNRMLGLIPNRINIFLTALKSKTNPVFPRVDPASTASAIFHAPSYAQHGGRVPSGYELIITNPNGTLGTVYYTLDGSDPRMIGGELRPSALTYAGPVPLAGSMNVRSRVKDGNVWSAINEAAFSVGTVAPVPSNLTVSKIMWKPAPPTEADILAGFTDDSEFEYLELYNPSTNPVDLTGIAFSAGLDIEPMSGDPVDIAPGGRVVLAAKPSAFLHRYGGSPKVVGKFVNDSNLSGSERITLTDSGGNIITSFIYNNTDIATGPWPKTETSGTGAALVLIQPELKPEPSLGANWRASLPNNPAPGSDDRPDLTKWQLQHFGGATDLSADTDADGLANLVEFALGLDPNSGDDPSRLPAFSFTTDPVPALVFSFRRQKFLENLSWEVEHAVTLDTWSTAPGPVETLSIVDHGDGTETITYRSPLAEGIPARFFRLRLISQ